MEKRLILLTFLFVLISGYAEAIVKPRPIGNESRIKIVNYMPNSVFQFTGHYTYQSIIEFGLHEQIQTISMGTPTPWQIIPSGNRIFLKPVEENATTNMTVITDKRIYFFEMHADEAQGISDDELSFIIKFVYPENTAYQAIQQYGDDSEPDLTKPELYNLEYTISGSAKNIEPTQVFDDGEFTYFKFRDINAELPAIFLVDSMGREALLNYRVQHGYVIIERVAGRFTLRHGADIICVFNENYLKSS